ncbi:MAG: hypothetical protein COT06_07645 [Syntrophobacteraceae bacterium CG07_land_8_20_14_0_80_61_8]|nr:MAG: hypothetical protein COT06_07645 [Syntrophobacteraceae bacterium CG07_land_8_20_14_0_80_61_8]
MIQPQLTSARGSVGVSWGFRLLQDGAEKLGNRVADGDGWVLFAPTRKSIFFHKQRLFLLGLRGLCQGKSQGKSDCAWVAQRRNRAVGGALKMARRQTVTNEIHHGGSDP